MNRYFICIAILISLSICRTFGQNPKTISNWPPKAPEFFDQDRDNIIGIGGKDYPIHAFIPKTSFTCSGQLPGFYADQETQCQVFHLCANNHKTSFLCGNGTIFNQRLFTCNWWYYTTCDDSHKFYSLNAELYKVKEKPNENSNKKSTLNDNRVPAQRQPNARIHLNGQQINTKSNNEVIRQIDSTPKQTSPLISDSVVKHVLLGTDSEPEVHETGSVDPNQGSEETAEEEDQTEY